MKNTTYPPINSTEHHRPPVGSGSGVSNGEKAIVTAVLEYLPPGTSIKVQVIFVC